MSEPTPFQQTVHILDIDTIQTQSNGVERSLFSQSIFVHVIFFLPHTTRKVKNLQEPCKHLGTWQEYELFNPQNF